MNFYHNYFQGGCDHPNDMYMITDIQEDLVCKVCKRKPKFMICNLQNNNIEFSFVCGYHKEDK